MWDSADTAIKSVMDWKLEGKNHGVVFRRGGLML